MPGMLSECSRLLLALAWSIDWMEFLAHHVKWQSARTCVRTDVDADSKNRVSISACVLFWLLFFEMYLVIVGQSFCSQSIKHALQPVLVLCHGVFHSKCTRWWLLELAGKGPRNQTPVISNTSDLCRWDRRQANLPAENEAIMGAAGKARVSSSLEPADRQNTGSLNRIWLWNLACALRKTFSMNLSCLGQKL